MRKKHVLKLFTCKICEKVVKGKQTLERHVQVIHSANRKKFTCEKCQKSFDWASNYNRHMLTHSGKQFTCKVCDFVCAFRHNLKSHMNVHSDPKFKCEICNKLFRIKYQYNMHLKSHEGLFDCEFCHKSFSRPNKLKVHKNVHCSDNLNITKITVKKKPFVSNIRKCTSCLENFRGEMNFIDHLMRHTSEKLDLHCKICNKDFETTPMLRRHSKFVHSIKERRMLCYFCNKVVIGLDNYEIHMRSHTHEYNFECNICLIKFDNNCELEQHKNIQPPNSKKLIAKRRPITNKENVDTSIKKPKKLYVRRPKFLQCALCQETFTRTIDFEKHVRLLHTKEIPFMCDKCPMSFPNYQQLFYHNKSAHTIAKIIRIIRNCKICAFTTDCLSSLHQHVKTAHEQHEQCYFCLKSFTIKRLKIHIQTHTKERSSLCKLCGKDFTSNTNLDFHIAKLHIKEQGFSCYFCKNGFLSGYYLIEHMKQNHTMERTHTCYFCKISFSKHVTLQSHMVRHTKERPYQCSECKQCYRNGSNYRYHMAFFQKGVPPKCVTNPGMQTLKYDYFR